MGGEVFLTAFLLLIASTENAVPPRYTKEQNLLDIGKPQEKELYIGAIFPINGTGGWLGGQGCLPAALMALDDVNAEPNILPGYKLMMPFFDSQVSYVFKLKKKNKVKKINQGFKYTPDRLR